MSKARSHPPAVIHRQILDVAENRPDASIEEIVEQVNGATMELVERVLDRYGDPGREEQASHEVQSTQEQDLENQSTMGTNNSSRELNELSDGQRETLRAIYEYPNATQRQLADELNVTGATINSRVNSIEGFDWAERQTFVENYFSENPTKTDGGAMSTSLQQNDGNGTTEEYRAIDELWERVEQLEGKIEDQTADRERIFDDPELVHKVVHACLASENITEDEELRILGEFIQP